jgi:hypothetical protein
MRVTVVFADCLLTIFDGWADVTDDLPSGSPATLARTDGVGVLQFSTARYSGGKRPTIESADLNGMLCEFAAKRGLGAVQEVRTHQNACFFVSADFENASELIRAWYVSDGTNIALITYTTEAGESARASGELDDADQIVRSLRFPESSE